MRIEIYRFRPGSNGRLELDPDCLVAKVEIIDGRAEFEFFDLSRERRLREVFEEELTVLVEGAVSAGVAGDAVRRLPAFSDEAIFHLLRWVLPGEMSLAGAIVEP